MLYLRRSNITITLFRGVALNIQDLRFTFNIEKRIDRFYQRAVVTVYNLSANIESDIFKNGDTLTLNAGYESGPYGVIFKGNIIQCIRGKDDSATTFIRLIVVDDPLDIGFCNFVMSQGQTAQQIAEQVCRVNNVPFDVNLAQVNAQQTQRGKAVFGHPKDVLRNLAINNNAGYFTNNGTVTISPLSKSPPAVIPALNAQSGMIGLPQQIDQGVRVRSLINSNFTLDSWVRLDNRTVILNQLEPGVPQTLLDLDGLYRIIGINATGDSRGQDWYYDLEVISQTGSVPALIAGQGYIGL